MTARILGVITAMLVTSFALVMCEVGNTGYRVARALHTAQAARREGAYDEAWLQLERTLQQAPNAAELWFDLGQTYRAAWYFRGDGTLLNSAISAYRRASELNPASAVMLAELGQTYRLAGRHLDADRSYRRALTRDPNNPGLLVDHARALEDAGRVDAALAQYRAANDVKYNAYSHDAELRLGERR